MIKKFLAIPLSAFIFAFSISSSTTAFAQTTATTADIEKVRSKVQTLSVNRDKQIEVKLRDNTKYKGHITSVEPDSFTLTESKTSRVQKFSYSEVDDVKKSGGGVSSMTWLILGGAVAGGVATWLIVKPAVCDGGAQTRGIC